MENKALKAFSLFMGIAVFLVIMLAVGRLFRVALYVFGGSGLIMLIWMSIILRADARRKQKHDSEVVSLDLQRKLQHQLEELEATKHQISLLEEQANVKKNARKSLPSETTDL